MRILQNLLLLVGATALGCVLGCLLMKSAMRMMFTEPRGEEFGGAGIWLGCICCGGLLSAGVGFMLALQSLGQHNGARWKATVWIGILVGALVGLGFGWRLFARVDLPFQVPAILIVVAACGMIAGGAISIVASIVRSAAENRG